MRLQKKPLETETESRELVAETCEGDARILGQQETLENREGGWGKQKKPSLETSETPLS
jgi:hypothetical protein